MINKPVFIIGCPRSGTTILLNVLSSHEEFAWISQFYNYFPKLIAINSYNRLYDLPLLGKKFLLKRNNLVLPHPVEPWIFWNTYLSNFQWERKGRISPIKREKKDITSHEINKIRKIIELILKYQNKDRFLSKYTDFSRINYLLQVFSDAQFIHLLRDGRAVANSYYNKIKEGKFDTWEEREWWIQGWPESWREEWKEKYNSLISLVAYQWKFFLKEIWEDAKSLPYDQYLEVRYEDFMEFPKETVRRILRFCGLEFTQRVEEYLNFTPLKNKNYRWKQNLTQKQKEELESIIVETKYRRLLEDSN